MEVRLALAKEIEKLSQLSVQQGNIPLFPDQSKASLLLEDDEIIGFAAVQMAWHAAGSWIKEEHRRQRHTYELRQCLDDELRRQGIPVYFAIPGSDFEKDLFRKYGHTTEHLVQVRHL